MKLKTYMEMDIDELEEIIEDAYDITGRSIELVADMELNNYSYFKIQETKRPLDKRDQEELDEFKRTGNAQYKANTIWQDLVNRDVLSEDLEYLIIINW